MKTTLDPDALCRAGKCLHVSGVSHATQPRLQLGCWVLLHLRSQTTNTLEDENHVLICVVVQRNSPAMPRHWCRTGGRYDHPALA